MIFIKSAAMTVLIFVCGFLILAQGSLTVKGSVASRKKDSFAWIKSVFWTLCC